MQSNRIKLTPQQAAIVRAILRTHLPDREVWVFGSRIGDHPKPYSDLDLLVQGDVPLSPETVIALKEAFDDSNLPFQVDIVEWACTSEKFRRIISTNYVILQPGPVNSHS